MSDGNFHPFEIGLIVGAPFIWAVALSWSFSVSTSIYHSNIAKVLAWMVAFPIAMSVGVGSAIGCLNQLLTATHHNDFNKKS
jgi:hypothetical protein